MHCLTGITRSRRRCQSSAAYEPASGPCVREYRVGIGGVKGGGGKDGKDGKDGKAVGEAAVDKAAVRR